MTRRLVWIGLLLATVLSLAVLLASWRELHRPFAGWKEQSDTACVVILTPGSSATRMIDSLAKVGIVRRPGLLRWWLKISGDQGRLKSGEYAFDRAISPLQVLEKLKTGEVVLHPVTIPEGLSVQETATRLAGKGFGREALFLEAMSDPSILGTLDEAATDLEGYLFPDTYFFPLGESEGGIVAAMVLRFQDALAKDIRTKAAAMGMSLREVLVLASLIEKETSLPEERERISRVFHNRLARKMRLQCDPTVIYALRREGRKVGKLTFRDLEFPSPWNTYKTAGLPPGPICSPGAASILAAVQPSEGEDLYFVASPDGGHRFSTTLSAHTRAVREYRGWVRRMKP